MANPNLKAEIEAAKSALEEGKNNPLSNQDSDDPNLPKAILKTKPDADQSSPSTADAPTTFELDATKLDARLTCLENKLAENQRDLYTLLGKIREVTRLQNDTTNITGPRNTTPKDVSPVEHNAGRHRGRKIAITLAVLTGIILGGGFFLASDVIDGYFAHLRTWAMQFVNFIDDIAR